MEHEHIVRDHCSKDHKVKPDAGMGFWYCPMLCEGDKKYDKPGNCPVCGMHLVKEETVSRSVTEYTCPMHPEIIRNSPGSCPICGMDLVPRTVTKEYDKEEKQNINQP